MNPELEAEFLAAIAELKADGIIAEDADGSLRITEDGRATADRMIIGQMLNNDPELEQLHEDN